MKKTRQGGIGVVKSCLQKYIRCSRYNDVYSDRGRAVKALVLGTSSKDRAFKSLRSQK